eukprot:349676-Pleurochrysis_carterae.AAC.1
MGWLWIGTYSQVLGHVNGKAKGVYGIFVGDEEAAGEDRVAPRKMHGVAQLGEHVVNPSFLCRLQERMTWPFDAQARACASQTINVQMSRAKHKIVHVCREDSTGHVS